MSIRRQHNGSSSKSSAKLAFLRDKSQRLANKVKASMTAAFQRHESRVSWWQQAFRTPLVGFYGWVRSRCSSLWSAMMMILGLARPSRLAPRGSDIKASKRYRQSFTRNMLYAESLESRQLLAVNILANDTPPSEGTPIVNGQFKIISDTPVAADTVVTFTVGGSAKAGAAPGGTAADPIDYKSIPTSATILSGKTSAVVDVTVFDDQTAEDPETETVVLTLVSAGAEALGPNKVATVKIGDNDASAISIVATDNLISKEDTVGETGKFVVTLTKASSKTSDIWLDVNLPNSSSKASFTDWTASLTAGATLTTGTAAVGGGVASRSLTGDVATITTNSAHSLVVGQSVVIAGINSTYNGTYPVKDVLSSTSFTFDKVALDEGTTASGGSVTTVSNALLSVPAGVTEVTITVSALADTTVEQDEAIDFVLASVKGGGLPTVGALNSATITIVDDDLATVTMLPAPTSILAGNDPAGVPVSTTAFPTGTDGKLWVSLDNKSSTATVVNYTVSAPPANGDQVFFSNLSSLPAQIATAPGGGGTVGIASGTLEMRRSGTTAMTSANSATLTVDLTSARTTGGAVLTFDQSKLNSEANDGFPSMTPFTVNPDVDGVAISTDGVNWYPVLDIENSSSYTINLEKAAYENGLELGSNFRIRFLQFDSGTGTNTNGRRLDNIRVFTGDYEALSGQVTIPANSFSASIDIKVINDLVVEGTESVTVTLTTKASGNAGVTVDPLPANLTQTVTITDSDTAVLTLVPAGDGSEIGPVNGKFNVNLTNNAVTIPMRSDTNTTVTFEVDQTVSKTATYGVDYTISGANVVITQTTPVVRGKLMIPAGQTQGTISVDVINESDVEDDEFVSIKLLNSGGNKIVGDNDISANLAPASIKILDEDASLVRINKVVDGAEPGTNGLFLVDLVRTLDLVNTQLPVTNVKSSVDTIITYTVTGTAKAGPAAGAGNDYQTLSGVITITAGQSQAFINVNVFDDLELEPTETVIVTLDTVTGDASTKIHPSQKSSTVNIVDDDTISVQVKATKNGMEDKVNNKAGLDATDGEFVLSLFSPNAGVVSAYNAARPSGAAGNVVVTYTVTGLASNGLDYQLLTGTATISTGSLTTSILVDVIDDNFFDPAETVTITLDSVKSQPSLGSGGKGVVVDATPDTVTIVDDEKGSVNLFVTKSARESNTNGELTFTLDSPSPFNTVVTYAVTPNGPAPIATQGVDHSLTSGSVTFLAGETSKKVVVPVLNDDDVESTEFIPVQLTGFAVGGNGGGYGFDPLTKSVNVPILADQTVDIVGTVNGSEGGVISPRFIIGMQAPSTAPTVVTYQIISKTGDAVSPSDYATLSPTSVTIPTGSTTAEIVINVNDDGLIEDTEYLTIKLVSVTNVDDPDIKIGAASAPNASPISTFNENAFGSTIATSARTGSTVTLTTTFPHRYLAGQQVAISGVGGVFDGNFVVTSTPTSTSFTYTTSTSGNIGQANVVAGSAVREAGDLPATALTPEGSFGLTQINGSLSSVNDRDMYLIHIDNPATFSATTASGFDTQLFLFKADGKGVVSNNDNGAPGLQATVGIPLGNLANAPFSIAPGDYYLAISSWNSDPTSGGNLIWLTTPFGAHSTPNGAGALGAINGWTNSGFAGGAYAINLTGASYAKYDAIASLAIADNDAGFVQVSGTNGKEGGADITFTIVQSAASSTATVVTYTLGSPNSTPQFANPSGTGQDDHTRTYGTFSTTIAAGQTSAVVTVPITDDNIVEANDETVVLTVTGLNGDPQIKLGTINGETLIFQQGLGGYTGTKDTFIAQTFPNLSFDTSPFLSVGTDFLGFGSTNAAQSLIRFENIIGSGLIPPNSTIGEAKLLFDAGGANVNLHQMLAAWNPTDTYSGAFGSNGIQPNGLEAALNFVNGFNNFDVTQSLQNWVNGGTNNGWAILPASVGPFWDANSSEAGFNQPSLVITVATSASATIEDNDSATVNISSVVVGKEPGGPLTGPGSVTGLANAGRAIVSINKASSTNTIVTYTITDGTATGGGVDHKAPTGLQTATIVAGQTSTTIFVEVTDDFTVEGQENVTVTLQSVLYSVSAAVTQKSATTTTVTLSAPGHSHQAGDVIEVAIGDPRFDGRFLVTSVAGSNLTYSKAGTGVGLTTVFAGSVSRGTDPQITMGTDTTKSVPIDDNDIGKLSIAATEDGYERNPSVVTGRQRSGSTARVFIQTALPGHELMTGDTIVVAGIGAPFNGTFVITNNPVVDGYVEYTTPSSGTVAFATASGSVNGGPNSGKFTITTDFAADTDTVIPYQILITTPSLPLNDATPGAANDYVLKSGTTTLSGTVTLPAFLTSVEVTIDVLEDFINEGNETVTLKLSTPNAPGKLILGPTDKATATIFDDDNLLVSVVATDPSVTEGADAGIDDGLLTIGMNYKSDSDIQVVYTVSGTATPGLPTAPYTNGNDYAPLPGTGSTFVKTIVIAAGSTQFKLPVEAYQDFFDEIDETVIVTLNSITALEPGTSKLSNNGNIALDATKLTDTVTIVDEVFDITIMRTDSPATEPGLGLGGFNGQFTVFITNDLPFNLTVFLQDQQTAGPGKATLGADYTYNGSSNPNQSVVILAGQTSASIPVTVIDDLLSEGNETIDMKITGFTPTVATLGSLKIGSPSTAVETIFDNDNINVTITAPTGLRDKIGPLVTEAVDGNFIINRGFDSPYYTVVSYEVDGPGTTATADTDYVAIPAEVTIGPGSTTAAVLLDVLGDAIVEGDETVKLKITNVESFTTAAGPIVAPNPVTGIGNSATATIADEDEAQIKITGTADAGEPSKLGFFTIEMSNPASTPTVVSFSVTGGTATEGSDYTQAPTAGGTAGKVTIPAGATQAFITVTALDDDIVEANPETVQITLANAPDAGTDPQISVNAGQKVGTVNITDDEVVSVTIVKVQDAKEGGNNGKFQLNLVDAATGLVAKTSDIPITVTYQISGTAKAGTSNTNVLNGPDYQQLSTSTIGTIVFGANSSSATIDVNVFDDDFVENLENVTLRLLTNTTTSRAVSPATPVAAVTNKASAGTLRTLTAAGHGFVNGQMVVVSIGDSNYDGTFTISGTVTANTFQYTATGSVTGSAATTGRVALTANEATITSVSFTSPNVVTLNTSSAHTYNVGQIIKVALTPPDAAYDGTYVISSIPTPTSLTYARAAAAPAIPVAAGTVSTLANATVNIEDNDKANLTVSGGSFAEGNQIFDLAGANLTLTLDKAFDVPTTWTINYNNGKNTAATVTNKVLTSSVVTLTVPGHDFVVGQKIVVDISDPVFDGVHVLTEVTATTLRYVKVSGNVLPAAAAGTATGIGAALGAISAVNGLGDDIPGFDYDSRPDTVTIAAGAKTASFKVDFNEEPGLNLVEDDEFFLTSVTPNGATATALAKYNFDSTTTSKVTITNDDTATYSINNATVTELDPGPAMAVSASKLNGNSVTLTVPGHTINIGDLVQVTLEPTGTPFDGIYLVSGTTGTTITYGRTNGNINTGPTMGSVAVLPRTATLTFDVTVDNPSDMPIDILVDYADDTGVLSALRAKGASYKLAVPIPLGTDYDNDTDKASFPAGTFGAAGKQQVTVEVTADLIVEGGTVNNPGAETFTASTSIDAKSFSKFPQGARVFVNSETGKGTITDNDSAIVTISVGDGLAAETNLPALPNNGQFKISQSNPSSVDTVVQFTIQTGGTNATQDEDYELRVGGTKLSNQVTIPAGKTEVLIDVIVISDTIVEIDEFVVLGLDKFISNDPNVSSVFGPGNVVTVRIDDNDTAVLSVAATKNGSEPGGPGNDGQFTLSLTQKSASDTVVTYKVLQFFEVGLGFVGPAASAGSDYKVLSGKATITAGQLTENIAVEVLNDYMVEGTEKVTIYIDSFIGNPDIQLNTAARVATVDILDDADGLFIKIEKVKDGAEPGNGPDDGQFMLTLVDAKGAPVVVPFGSTSGNGGITVNFTVGGTASSPSDFSNINFGFIPEGQSTGIVTIDVQDDFVPEPAETVILTIIGSNPSGLNRAPLGTEQILPATGGANVAFINIFDNDGGGIPVAPVVESIHVNGTAGSPTAQRSNLKSMTVTFDSIVTVGAGAFTVQKRSDVSNIAPPVGTVTGIVVSPPVNTTGKSVVTITFIPSTPFVDGTGSLEDGNYQVVINPALVLAGGVTPLVGNAGDPLGGDFIFGDKGKDAFYRLYGDENGVSNVVTGESFVDFLDFLSMQSRVNAGPGAGDPAYRDYFDKLGDGYDDFLDFLDVQARVNLPRNMGGF